MPSHPDSTGEGLPLNRRDFLRLTGLGSLGLLVPGLLTGCGDDAVGVIGSPSYAATQRCPVQLARRCSKCPL